MPYVGNPVSVVVEATGYGAMVMLRNHSGSRCRFEVNDQVRLLDGNTVAGLVVAEPPERVKITADGYGLLWPMRELD
jgi:hypothetical protein